MKRLQQLLSIGLFSTVLYAGDPCPINYAFYNAVPSWLDEQQLLSKLKEKDYLFGIYYYFMDNFYKIDIVKKNSPASRAGIKVGDSIYQIDDVPIKNRFDFDKIVKSKKLNDHTVFFILRNKKNIKLTLTLDTL